MITNLPAFNLIFDRQIERIAGINDWDDMRLLGNLNLDRQRIIVSVDRERVRIRWQSHPAKSTALRQQRENKNLESFFRVRNLVIKPILFRDQLL